ncbi:rCG27549 [Rattus norvegicus]|uniref:RCG27549 n=1 Tax=Rattus norvegicus TaxID=10116 RepID=A6K790_RAT|nr:rCG27549 [Rattus norvegicus]
MLKAAKRNLNKATRNHNMSLNLKSSWLH